MGGDRPTAAAAGSWSGTGWAAPAVPRRSPLSPCLQCTCTGVRKRDSLIFFGFFYPFSFAPSSLQETCAPPPGQSPRCRLAPRSRFTWRKSSSKPKQAPTSARRARRSGCSESRLKRSSAQSSCAPSEWQEWMHGSRMSDERCAGPSSLWPMCDSPRALCLARRRISLVSASLPLSLPLVSDTGNAVCTGPLARRRKRSSIARKLSSRTDSRRSSSSGRSAPPRRANTPTAPPALHGGVAATRPSDRLTACAARRAPAPATRECLPPLRM